MARVTNNSSRPIGLARNVVIEPSQTLEVKHWDAVKGRPNVKHYLAEGILTVEQDKTARSKKADEPKEESVLAQAGPEA